MHPTDALYGFAGWLTLREETLEVGINHNAGPIAELVKEWAEHNGIPDVSPEYPNTFKQPRS